jgi:hypothetical protein
LFELDKVGVDGVNIQTVPGSVQEIFGPVAGDGGSMVVHPEFYGLMMFAQAAPAGSRLFTVPARLPSSVKLWATRATDGTVHIVLINTNFSKSATVDVPLSSPAGPGTLESLRAPHIGATSGVTIGGRTFGAATTNGLLPPYQLQPVTATGGRYAVRVPPATAIMLTVPGSASSATTTSTSSATTAAP